MTLLLGPALVVSAMNVHMNGYNLVGWCKL